MLFPKGIQKAAPQPTGGATPMPLRVTVSGSRPPTPPSGAFPMVARILASGPRSTPLPAQRSGRGPGSASLASQIRQSPRRSPMPPVLQCSSHRPVGLSQRTQALRWPLPCLLARRLTRQLLLPLQRLSRRTRLAWISHRPSAAGSKSTRGRPYFGPCTQHMSPSFPRPLLYPRSESVPGSAYAHRPRTPLFAALCQSCQLIIPLIPPYQILLHPLRLE